MLYQIRGRCNRRTVGLARRFPALFRADWHHRRVLLLPILTVDRERFELTLWKPALHRYVPKRRWKIAVGVAGHETPAGMYFVEAKTRTPDWLAPDAEWVAEEDRGHVFPFKDPKNPFAGGFVSVSSVDGIGIHGTKFPPRVGERVSHGCIRMEVRDFLALYSRVERGTPVFIY